MVWDNRVSERKLALLVEYDGTAYCGFQYQPGCPTIQGELESALKKLTGNQVRVAGASRTDAGVHAQGQVASFCTNAPYPLHAFVDGLNFYLSDDIRVQRVCEVDIAFDPRRSAISREYEYSLLAASAPSALRRRFIYHIPQRLELDAMGEAAAALVGVHDFASFTERVHDGRKSTIREVRMVGFEERNQVVVFKIEANAFLPQQVRRTIGALLQVGLGKKAAKEFHNLVIKGEPGVAGPTLPAHGLCLTKINYGGLFEHSES